MSHYQPLRSDSMAKLKPHPSPNVDGNPTSTDTVNQHRATSHLLDPQPHQQTLNGYDGHDMRALKGDLSACDKPSSSREDSATVHWKGIPPYLLTWELLGIVLSAGFLALGACVASLQGKPQSDWSERIIQATKLAPSVWPIVFSGVIGGAVRIFAEWRVERGIPLLALEQLLGSLSMASSVITIFRWSIFRFSSAALILLWAFDPLGSQASFRAAYLQSSTGTIQGSITAYNPNLTTQLAVSTYQSASTRSKPIIRALYSASLYDYVASTQYVDPTSNITQDIITVLGGPQSAAIEAATDTWGNVRVPNLEYLSNYNESQPHQWLRTPWDQQVLNYSSLLGERVSGIDRNFTGNTTFVISSSYQRFSCIPWFYLNTSAPFINGSRTNTSEADTWLMKNTGSNYYDNLNTPYTKYYHISRTFFVSLSLRNMTTKKNTSELIFASGGASNDNQQLSVTKCMARTMYVDANVTCISKGTLGKAICGVDAIRETPEPPADPNDSVLKYTVLASRSFDFFTDLLDDNQSGSGQSSNTEFYLHDPSTAFTKLDARNYTIHLGDLNIGLFERRFSLLWNTLWKLGWATDSVMGGEMKSSAAPGMVMLQNTTSQVTFPLPPVYRISGPWITLYFVSASVMFFVALFSLFMHSQCHAPTILGFVSSLIRDSAYFDHCGVYHNSAEDGPEKSKRLAALKVMVADVSTAPDKAGKIAFAPVGIGKRVEKGKWYE